MLMLPVTLAVSEMVAVAVKDVLDKGSSVFFTVAVNLVLEDGKGGSHVLDTVESDSVEIKPDVPVPTG